MGEEVKKLMVSAQAIEELARDLEKLSARCAEIGLYSKSDAFEYAASRMKGLINK